MVGVGDSQVPNATRILVKLSPKRHCNSSPVIVDWAVEVIMLRGTEVGVNLQDALKIWRSFRPGFSRMCCGVKNMLGQNLAIHEGRGMT